MCTITNLTNHCCVATTKTTFSILRSANSEIPQRQRARLNSSVWLETQTISFSSMKHLFVYYHVKIYHYSLDLCRYFLHAKVVTLT